MPSLGHIAFAELRDAYQVQMDGLLEGGVDLLIIETQYDLLGLKAAMIAARRAMAAQGREVPLQVQVTIELTGRMLPGTEIGAALAAVDPLRPDVVGLNCATGPNEMGEHLRHLSQHARMPISCLPNAGLPSVVDGKMAYDLTPDQLAEHHRRFITELGVQVVGGCCGTGPEHIRRVVEECQDLTPAPRTPVHEPGATSIYSHVPFEQDTSFLIIGERTNANGSKKFREAMLESDWDTCVLMGRDQLAEGAHVLDLCVDYVGRDGTVDMDELASRFGTQVAAPLVLDSTEPQVMEAGLQHIGGRSLLNSANLEDGEAPGSRMDRVFTLCKEYGAAAICLLIDEEGQARDVEWKLRVAHRIHDIAVDRYGLEPSDLVFDALTFPLSTGDEDLRKDGLATIDAIRRIKAELPGVHTTLGVSNVSFGLKPAARHVLNSVFLHECVEAGLDSAIVHAARIMPLNRIPDEQRQVALDLVHDRRGTEGGDGTDPDYDPLHRLLALFEDVEVGEIVKEDRSGWPVEQRLSQRIIDGERDGLEADLDDGAGDHAGAGHHQRHAAGGHEGGRRALRLGRDAAALRAAVGRDHEGGRPPPRAAHGQGRRRRQGPSRPGHGEGRRPRHRQEPRRHHPHQQRLRGAQPRHQDLHHRDDREGQGRAGRRHRDERTAGQEHADHARQPRGAQRPGPGRASRSCSAAPRSPARTSSGTCGRSTRVDSSTARTPSRASTSWTASASPAARARSWATGASCPRSPRSRLASRRSSRPATSPPSTCPSAPPRWSTTTPSSSRPFVGTRLVKGIALDEVAAYLNETALFRNQWQFRPEGGEDDAAFKDRIRPMLREQLAIAKADDLLVPQVVYGFFAANKEGDDLVIWKDETRTGELARFTFPRQTVEPYLCISDFFRSTESGEADYAAFHLVTMGAAVSERTAELFAADRYQDYLMLHGLGVEMAEALAEYWHRRIREEWGFADEDGPDLNGLFRQKYRGGRYSFGYPACPDLADNEKAWELLDGGRLGIEVSEETGYQFQPEQTTCALICHHPRAKYFVARK